MKYLLPILLCFCLCDAFGQTFGTEREITRSLDKPIFIFSLDMDFDGDIDIFSASNDDAKIAWYENDGTGKFLNQTIISESAAGATSVFAVDIDQDGDIDVVSSSEGDDKIAWYENDGSNYNFVEHYVGYSDEAEKAVAVAVDMDGDNDVDILYASGDAPNNIRWSENEGNGEFNLHHTVFSPFSPFEGGVYQFMTSDIDLDGDVDIIVSAGSEISKFENDGNGNFGEAETLIPTGYRGAVLEDMDSDGDMDIVIRTVYQIKWFENDGLGAFGAERIIFDDDNFFDIESMYPSDVDGDGDNDILCVYDDFDDDYLVWIENDGLGNFDNQVLIDGELSLIDLVYSADLNGDGNSDVVVASEDWNTIDWYAYDGAGGFGGVLPISEEQRFPDAIFTADFDGDGDEDVLTAGDGNALWYRNLGNNNFSNQNFIGATVPASESVFAADIDSDGDIDAIVSSRNMNKIVWYPNDGDGNFGSEILITSETAGPVSIVAVDLDQDEDVDILSASRFDSKITWYANDGNGNFGPQLILDANATQTTCVFAIDLDNDEDQDVLFTSTHNDNVKWCENIGGGNFNGAILIADNADGANQVISADVDNDGDNDVVYSSLYDNKIALRRNDGNGVFGSQEIIDLVDGIQAITHLDVDSDGDIDIISGSWGIENTIFWYENDGAGLFTGHLVNSGTNDIVDVHAADLDGDGDKDLINRIPRGSRGCSLYNSHGNHFIKWYENHSGDGCTDENACNFNVYAWVEDGTCCYGICGCSSPLASNYFENIDCEIDCEFQYYGHVFNDENQNGIFEEEESGLAFQEVTIDPQGISLITDDQGYFTFSLAEEEFTIQVEPSEAFPFPTTLNTLFVDPDEMDSVIVNFGFSFDAPSYDVEVNFYPHGNTFLCNDQLGHEISFRNIGNVPIDGIVELEYDELFQGHEEITPIDSVNENVIYMSFESLLPGDILIYDISLYTPTVDYIGDYVTSHVRVKGFYNEEQVAFGEDSIHMEITCAYDPNDKQPFPLGYTEEHWLLPETEQEFLVRFQNTGNAPAQNIRIQDTIDVYFDLSTFKLVSNTHSVMTTINEETRVVDFFFEDIQLLDSLNNEPESHGLISYAITPHLNLPVGTVLNNTAYIYFDNNEAIVTNTTWTTIHECGGESVFNSSIDEICMGETVSFEAMYENVEEYMWILDGDSVGVEENYEYTFNESGEYEIQLVSENPLCAESSTQMISVTESPSSSFELSGTEFCEGEVLELTATGDNVEEYFWSIGSESIGNTQTLSVDLNTVGDIDIQLVTENSDCVGSQTQSITVFSIPLAEITENGAILTASEGTNYQWLLNGELIEGATSQVYEVIEDGSYSVEITNEANCSSLSAEVMIVNINELDATTVLIYPNPMTSSAYLDFRDAQNRTVKLVDSNGKQVRVWNNISVDLLEIKKGNLSEGNYVIQITEGEKEYTVSLLIVK